MQKYPSFTRENLSKWKQKDFDRFWSYVNKTETCWLWTGSNIRKGYGRFSLYLDGNNTRTLVTAHRVSFVLSGQDILGGMVLDHICKNKLCINPRHLRLVTQLENIMAGNGIAKKYAARSECSKGHPLSGSNLMVRQDSGRRCRICRNKQNRDIYYKNLAYI